MVNDRKVQFALRSFTACIDSSSLSKRSILTWGKALRTFSSILVPLGKAIVRSEKSLRSGMSG